jgi:hypothetical protein
MFSVILPNAVMLSVMAPSMSVCGEHFGVEALPDTSRILSKCLKYVSIYLTVTINVEYKNFLHLFSLPMTKAGFEPVTSGLRVKCPTPLSYSRWPMLTLTNPE